MKRFVIAALLIAAAPILYVWWWCAKEYLYIDATIYQRKDENE